MCVNQNWEWDREGFLDELSSDVGRRLSMQQSGVYDDAGGGPP